MTLEAMVLCDAATDYHGKLNILGAFDCIWVRKLPAVHPQCAVALRLRFTQIEEGAHEIKINVVDPDGKPVVPPLKGNIQIRIPESSDSAVANLILNLQGVKLEKDGPYSVDMAVDGRQEASLPFYVRRVPEQPQAAGQAAPPADA